MRATGCRTNRRTKVGDIDLLVGKHGTCKVLHDRGNIRQLMEVSPFSTTGHHRASFTDISIVPRLSSDIRVSVSPSSLQISAFHSSNTNNRRVGGARSTIQVARLPAKVIITSRTRHSRLRGQRATVDVLGSGLCRLRRRGRTGRHTRVRNIRLSVN